MGERPKVVLRVALEERYLRRLRDEFPAVEFQTATTPEDLDDVLGEADALVGGSPLSAGQLAAARRLRWVQVTSAGVEAWVTPELSAHRLVLTNFSGTNAPNIADHVLALLLAFARGLKPLLERQRRHEWGEEEPPTFEPAGQTLGIVGLGEIGESLAHKAAGLGMRVLALARHPHDPPPGVERVLPSEELPELLGACDHVVLCLPLTDATEHIIGAAELGQMRRSAYLYNIGRGGLIDQEALIAALREGRLAGAGLDVTDPEPLPADSPLWDLPNVIITGHTAGATPLLWDRGIELLSDNVRRFLAGEELRNTVDTKAGY
jgi:phosphoglycerate dehydrogenase-like enzyme